MLSQIKRKNNHYEDCGYSISVFLFFTVGYGERCHFLQLNLIIKNNQIGKPITTTKKMITFVCWYNKVKCNCLISQTFQLSHSHKNGTALHLEVFFHIRITHSPYLTLCRLNIERKKMFGVSSKFLDIKRNSKKYQIIVVVFSQLKSHHLKLSNCLSNEFFNATF